MHVMVIPVHDDMMWYVPSAPGETNAGACSILFTPLFLCNTNVTLICVISGLSAFGSNKTWGFHPHEHKAGKKLHVLFLSLRLELPNDHHT